MDLQYEEIFYSTRKRNERRGRRERQLQCRGGQEEGIKIKEEKIGMRNEKVKKGIKEERH